MRITLPLALAAALLAGCATQPAPAPAAAAATPPAPEQTAAAAAPADAKPKLICIDEPVTGSHVRRAQRRCATAEEWDRMREQTQKDVIDMSGRAQRTTPAAGGR
jgi:hypothetical protein